MELLNSSGIKISVRHKKNGAPAAVIVAPGFFQSKETGTFKRIERDLSPDFDVISMDFRGHGKSGGLYTFSAKETEDLKAVADYARAAGYGRVGALGFSYGGTIAILEAAEHRNLDSLVCVGSPMASEEVEFKWWTFDAMKLGLKGLELGAGVRAGNPYLRKTKAIDAVAGVSAPMFFIHGEKDPTVGARHSLCLHEKASGQKQIRLFSQGSHAEELYRQYPEEFMRLVKDWFRKTL